MRTGDGEDDFLPATTSTRKHQLEMHTKGGAGAGSRKQGFDVTESDRQGPHVGHSMEKRCFVGKKLGACPEVRAWWLMLHGASA
jgi:hypothetical protein